MTDVPQFPTRHIPAETIGFQEPQAVAPAQNHPVDDFGEHQSYPFIKIIIGILVFLFAISLLWLVLSRFFQGGSKNVTVTYWGLWEDQMVMQPILDDFHRLNPTITVQYIKEDPKQYMDRLLTRIQNGNGPDIFRFHNSWIPVLLPQLLPMPSSIMTKQEFNQSFYPVIQLDLVKNGAIYGIPLEIDTLALFTNTDLLQKQKIPVPINWIDFIASAKSLTTKDQNGKIKIAGAAMGTFDNITHAPDIISLLFAQNGVDLHNFSASTQNASDALTFYTSFAKGDGNVWDNTLDRSLSAFAKGSLAMYLGFSWDIFTLKTLNPNLNFAVNPVPHLPGRDMTIASYWAEGVSVKSTHQKESLLFLKYLAQKDTQQKLYSEEAKTRMFGELFPRPQLADNFKSNSLIYPFVAQAGNATSSFFAGETQDTGINAHMNGYLANAVNAMVQTNISAESAVDTLAKGITQVLQQYAAK